MNINFTLKCPIGDDFYCSKAKNSVDLNENEKAMHKVSIENVDIPKDFKVGYIVGNSGSGKTTLAKHLFEKHLKKEKFDYDKPVLSQFDKDLSYEERVRYLNYSGISSIPSWVKPMKVLSNGEKMRAELALTLSRKKEIYVFDEWTSVVDRTIGKLMSEKIKKLANKLNKKIIVISCHFDVEAWLEPDWTINMNEQKFYLKKNSKNHQLNSTSNQSTNGISENLASIII